MDHFEIEETLKTFRIVTDTREHNIPQAAKRFKSFGVPVERATLYFGDYCANISIDGIPLLDTSRRIIPACVIERKMSLDELAGNFTRGRDRFRREFERARDAKAKIYLLVENGSYEAIIKHRYRSRYHPKAFLASLTAWMVRYDATPVFCRAESSGMMIREILYRDLKERMGGGEYG